MSDAIVDATNIDTSVFSYSKPKPHASGGVVVNLINSAHRESLTLALPLLLTWGTQEVKDPAGNPTGKFTMSLQFPSSEYSNPDAEACLNSLKALMTAVKQAAITNSKEWFGKDIKSMEVIEEKFNTMLRHPKVAKGSPIMDESKPPTLTVKIPQWSGVWKPEIYDEDGEPLFVNGKVNSHLSPLEFLKPKSHVICLIQCGGLWFVNGKCSITWNLKQAVVQKPKQTIEGTCFLRPKTADVEKMKALPPPEEVIYDDVSTVLVEDTDEEAHTNLDEVYSASQELKAKRPLDAVEEPVAKRQAVEEPVAVEAPDPVVAQDPVSVEVKTKKKVIRKKSDV